MNTGDTKNHNTDMGKKTILVIDDEVSIRVLMKKLLGNEYNIMEASDGKEGVDMAYKLRPDLIMMDIMMPEMDGISAAGKIKSNKETKSIPLVMISGLGHQQSEKLTEEHGIDAYINKPFSVQEIRELVNKLLNTGK